MKREAVGHTKMKRLCRRLDIPTYQGVGLLESLWHLTAREAPRGDIGKLSDEDIALGIDYRGDETHLIECLVQSGWIDRSDQFRLLVHDWDEHADDAVNLKLARSNEFFCTGAVPNFTRIGGKERESIANFYSVRMPCAQNSDPCALPVPSPPSSLPVPEPVVEVLCSSENPDEPHAAELPSGEPARKPDASTGIAVVDNSRGTRLSAEELPEAWEVWAMTDLGWDQVLCRSTFLRFRDHWIGKPGKDGRKANWLATWRNWCRDDVRRDSRGRGSPLFDKQPSHTDRAIAVVRSRVEKGERPFG
jgi:hypothetical protein